ncbi:MAG: DUF5666 domain-containing protein [Fimbriimonadaceae bacterium]
MKLKRLWVALIAAATVLLLIVGCGGGGSSSGGSVNTSQQVSMFVTDDLSTNYDHVWVRFHEVELEFSGGSSKVFSSDSGVEVDLRALNTGSANLFKFLGAAAFPSQPVTGIKFTVGRDLVLYTTGSTTGTNAQFAAAFNLTNGRSRFGITPASPLTVPAGGAVAFDFNLANWTLASGFVTPVGSVFGGSGLDDPANHVSDDFSGIVSELTGTAPNFTMKLTRTGGQVVQVKTDVNTSIFNSNGSASPVIANGKRIEVSGVFSTSTQSFLASVVKIEDSTNSEDEEQVQGLVRNPNEGAGQFEVKATETRGFLPGDLWVMVQTTGTTKFFNRQGVVISAAAFYAALTAGSAEAEGTYNSGSNTLTATKVKLEDGSGGEDYSEAKGPATAANAALGTLSITLNEWSGFAGSAGGTLNITTNGSTLYLDANGASINSTTFFAQALTATAVKVEGTYTSGSMLAKRLEIRSSGGGGGGGNNPHEINGTISNINSIAATFNVTLISWSGFTGTHSSVITVSMSASATYRNDNGDSITKDQFFADLASSPLVEVEGTVSGLTMTGVKAKLDDN